MSSRYDGAMPIPELLRCGDFGLGTLDYLDGEVDRPRRACVSGPWGRRGRRGGPERSTPFAIVTRASRVCRDWLIKLDGRRSDQRPPSTQEKRKP
jgi:alpha-acetolactate decarboxylase